MIINSTLGSTAPLDSPSRGVTGICVHQQFGLPNPVTESARRAECAKHNADVKAYFESLGYTVGWDFSHRYGSWHEIYDCHGLICQIDHDIPLLHIVEDLTAMAGGAKRGTSPSDYRINTEDHEVFQRFAQRVAKNGMGGLQMDLSI